MDIEQALTTYLKAQAGLTALIAGRFSFTEADAGTARPYVEITNISDVKDHLLSGQSSLERPMYQFTVYADSRSNSRAVAAQLKACLSDYHGVMSGITVQKIELQNELYSTYTNETQKFHTAYLEYQTSFDKE